MPTTTTNLLHAPANGEASSVACLVAGFLMGTALVSMQAISLAHAEDILANSRWAAGIFAHDRGPSSDNHENGVDLNGEIQFAPLDGVIGRAIGSPRPHLGATPNFNGQTSAIYGGLTYEVLPHPKWFIDGFIGLALHDGPLHKDPVGCRQGSDCGFGLRVLPRLGLETGINLSERHAVSLFYDHMSHGNLLNVENEGIDHVGIRYRYSY